MTPSLVPVLPLQNQWCAAISAVSWPKSSSHGRQSNWLPHLGPGTDFARHVVIRMLNTSHAKIFRAPFLMCKTH